MIEKQKSLLILFEGEEHIIENTLFNYAQNNGWTKNSSVNKEDYISMCLWRVITEGAISELFQGDETEGKDAAQADMDKVITNGI